MFSRRNLRSLPLIAGAVVPTCKTNMPLGQFKALVIPNLNSVVKSPNCRLRVKITKDRPKADFQTRGRVKCCAAYQTREGEMGEEEEKEKAVLVTKDGTRRMVVERSVGKWRNIKVGWSEK
ncbi:hypothetical protein MKW92_003292 [Papaver armeniacum]|nr:hypothetical protein MKW92_003292 [Papaver armeniacum]